MRSESTKRAVAQPRGSRRRSPPARRGPTRVGLMGGTFDPIHYGHLLAAEEARTRFSLARVVFIPCGLPPHKKAYAVTSAEHRYAMTLIATSAHPDFVASRMELERSGASYTVETLRQFRDAHPGVEVFFITGVDAVLEMLTWRDPQELVRLCRLVAVTRPGYAASGLAAALGDLARHVEVIAAPGVDISSTQIRERVARGQSIAYLTAPPVEAYIAKYGLYRGADSSQKGGEEGWQ